MRWKKPEKESKKPLKAQLFISASAEMWQVLKKGVRQGERDLGCCKSLSKMPGSADQAVTMESWE